MKRGEVWEADLPPPVNYRPVLILSRDWMPARRPEITVAFLATRSHHSPAEVSLTVDDDGVSCNCYVNLDAINTIPKDRLRRYVCTLSPARMRQVKAALEFALDLR